MLFLRRDPPRMPYRGSLSRRQIGRANPLRQRWIKKTEREVGINAGIPSEPQIPNGPPPGRRVTFFLPLYPGKQQHLGKPNLIIEHHLDPSLPGIHKFSQSFGGSAREKTRTRNSAPFVNRIERHVAAWHEYDV